MGYLGSAGQCAALPAIDDEVGADLSVRPDRNDTQVVPYGRGGVTPHVGADLSVRPLLGTARLATML